ncbi:MAG: hypothetical protein ABIG39_06815 [Candidatus Micrarchaeota archaeon]
MRALFIILLVLIPQPLHGIIIVPPVVYFLTLSLSTFLVNALVSLLLFGAFRGLLSRRYLGRTTYELARAGISAAGNGLITIGCMVASAIIIYPVDSGGLVFSGVLSGMLFLCFKLVSGFREYSLAANTKKRSILLSWALMSVFIALVTGISANLALEVHAIHTDAWENVQTEDAWEPIVGEQKSAQKADVPAAGIGYVGDAYSYDERIWFMPGDGGECKVIIGDFRKSFSPAFLCAAGEDRKRTFCPVWVSHDEVGERGNVAFTASGSCEDSGEVFISDYGFGEIKR